MYLFRVTTGAIDPNEFFQSCVQMQIEIKRKEVDQIWRIFDTDNSGELDFDEFLEIVESGGHRRRSFVRMRALRDETANITAAKHRTDRIKHKSQLALIITRVLFDLRKALQDKLADMREGAGMRRGGSSGSSSGNRATGKEELGDADCGATEEALLLLLFSKFDIDNGGWIDLQKFHEGLTNVLDFELSADENRLLWPLLVVTF